MHIQKYIQICTTLTYAALMLCGGKNAYAQQKNVQKPSPTLNIQEITTKNGLTAWLVEDKTLPIIALNFAFREIGSTLDPMEKQGLSRLASNTMDEGAGNLNSEAFQKALKDKSISLSFTSSRDSFGGQIKTLSKNAPRAFELLKMALNQPRFDEEPVERMRQANLSRIRESLSDPQWIAARIQNDALFKGHAYAQNSGGTLTTLQNITTDDLREFTQKLSKDRLVISAAGDITPSALKRAIEQVFGDLPETSPAEKTPDITQQNTGQTLLYKQDIPQTIVRIMHPGLDRTAPNYAQMQVLNYVLGGGGFGSRLMEEIREKRGLTYGIYTSLYDLDHFDGITVNTSTQNETAKELLGLLKTEWTRIAKEPISEKELKTAKSYLIGALPLSLTSTDKISGLLLSLQLSKLPINYLDQREKKIKATTIDNVSKLAKSILDTKKFTTILVGNPTGIKNATRIEALPNAE